MWWLRAYRAAALAVALAAAGCTAQPLYSGAVSPAIAPEGAPAGRVAALAEINVAPVSTRDAQVVRNELIFLLSGGRGNPAGAPYALALRANSRSESSTVVNTVGVEQAPTASVLSFIGTYTLTEVSSGRVLGRGTRRAVASYDVPSQPFAAQRAERDAENRAARELAAFLATAVAADLAHGRNAAAVKTAR